MESFIRSKYESRRWALDGPPPSDPSILDDETSPATQPPPEPSVAKVSSRPTHTVNSSTSSLSRTTVSPPLTTRQPQPHQLLSTAVAADRRGQVAAPSVVVPTPAEAQPKAPEPENDLFSLDFHAPPSSFGNSNNTANPQPKKDVKQDILSLFSAKPAAPQSNAFGQIQSSASPWDSCSVPQAQPQPTSMMGTSGVGAWGTSSGWGAAAPAPPAQGNLWGNPALALPTQQKQPDLFGSDIWGGSSSAPGGGNLWDASGVGSQKKDDAFGDIWGGFK